MRTRGEEEEKGEDEPEKGTKHEEVTTRELLTEMAGCGGDNKAEEGERRRRRETEG